MDRMLTQLRLAGLLGRVRGFVFGSCSKCEPGRGLRLAHARGGARRAREAARRPRVRGRHDRPPGAAVHGADRRRGRAGRRRRHDHDARARGALSAGEGPWPASTTSATGRCSPARSSPRRRFTTRTRGSRFSTTASGSRALEATGVHQVESVSAWDFYNKLGPGDFERILAEQRRLRLQRRRRQALPARPVLLRPPEVRDEAADVPDRTRLTVEAVRGGKAMMFLGGWYSFTGEIGKGGWGRTQLREILPVECLETEDLVESTEGFGMAATAGPPAPLEDRLCAHPADPRVQQDAPSPRWQCPGEVARDRRPAARVRAFGKGRVLAYTSDPAPHWGCNFVYADQYNAFWRRCLGDVLRRGGARSPRPARRRRSPASARR